MEEKSLKGKRKRFEWSVYAYRLKGFREVRLSPVYYIVCSTRSLAERTFHEITDNRFLGKRIAVRRGFLKEKT